MVSNPVYPVSGKHQRSRSCQLHPITSHYLSYVSRGGHLISALLFFVEDACLLSVFFFFFFATRLFSRRLLRRFFILQTVGTQSATIYKTLTKHQAELVSATLTVCCAQTHGVRERLQHPTWIPEDCSSPDLAHAAPSLGARISISRRPQPQLGVCERGIGTRK